MLKRLLFLCAICLVLFACEKSTEPEYKVATPTFNQGTGTYYAPLTGINAVKLYCAINGAAIRYTLDGTDPSTTSELYTAPLNINTATTIKAIAFKDKMKPSDIATATYSFSVGALYIVPLTGTFAAPQTVTISGLTVGTVIHYTTDGTEPTVDSSTYTGPFVVDGNVTLKAKGFLEGWAASTTKSEVYTFNVAQPTMSNTGGTFSAPVALTMNTTTAGASIHYTTDGSEPTVSSALYSEPLDINVSTSIKSKAFKTNWNSSTTVSANFVLKAVAPAFNPPQGTYSGPQTVNITTTTAGAQIYYTTDSSNPTTSSELYTGPLNLSLNTNIRAKAFKAGWTESNLANAEYYFSVATPVFDPLGGYYFGAQTISISCATPGATIRYTTNNTEPVPTSAIYENPINIANTTTLRAKAFKDGMATSTTAVAYYQITDQVATPVLSLAEGIYFEPQELTITCATDGAAIRYTTDGSDPTTTSTQYGFPLQISGYTHFKAKAFKTGWVDSQMAQAIYQFDTVNQIVAWGNNTYNQTNVPFGTDFIQVDAGMYHIIALRTDGSLAAWGRNNNQQCNFPPGNDYVAVSAGDNHSLALRANGTVVAWGLNDSLQCAVPDIPGNVYVAISAGGQHSLALTDDNKIVAWGRNDSGQGSAPPDSNFVQISAGANHNLALRANGSIFSWGSNDNGQINLFPGQNYMYVAAGDQHSVAIRLDGTIIAQGLNTNQQSTSPAGNNFVKVSAGYRHNLALKTDGSIITWGYSGGGLSAVPTVGSYVDISAGRDFSVALKTNTPPRKGSYLKAPKARLKLK